MLIDALVRIFGHNLPVFALLIVGFAIEKHYVSRVTVFTNAIALNVHFLSLNEAPRLLVWYGDLGLILGVIGFATYLLNMRTGILFNLPAYTFFSSLPVAVVILAGPSGWGAALVLTSLVSLIVGYYLEEKVGFKVSYWGPRPGEVERFVQAATMKFVDARGVRQTVDLSYGEIDW